MTESGLSNLNKRLNNEKLTKRKAVLAHAVAKLDRVSVMQREVDKDRSEIFKRYHRLMRESVTKPSVLFSPKYYSKLLLDRPVIKPQHMKKLV